MASFGKYKKKNGKTYWWFKAYLGTDASGKSKSTTRRNFLTKSDAKKEAARLEATFDARKRDPGNITVDELYTQWWPSYAKSGVKQSSMTTKRNNYYSAVKPALGKIYLKNLTPIKLQNFFDDLSYGIVPSVWSIVNQILTFAVKMELLDNSPLAKVTKPKAPRKQSTEPYSTSELSYFLSCIDKPRDLAYFRLLSFTGARKSEISALHKSDVDLDKGVIHIRGTVVPGNRIDSTKTDNAVRDVSIDEETVKIVKEWIDHPLCQFDLIFCKRDGGVLNVGAPNQWLRAIYKKHPELRQVRVHMFRHTHVSQLIALGATIPDIASRVGDSINTIMTVYAHSLKKSDRELSELFSRQYRVKK